MKAEIFRMEHIYVKRRGKNVLDNFRLNIYKGEFVSVFGYSGSGILELGEVLSGKGADKGRIWLDEKEIVLKKYLYPEMYGIYTIQNQNNLIPDLTVAENLFLGEKKHMFTRLVSVKKQEKLAHDILNEFGILIPVEKRGRELIYLEHVIIKLIKAYVKGAKLVILNGLRELPHFHEGEQILQIIKRLRGEGMSFLWINQKIEFVQDITQRVIIIKNGRNVKTYYEKEYTLEMLIRIAADSYVTEVYYPKLGAEFKVGENILCLEGISSRYLKDITLCAKKRQILGIWSEHAFSLMDFCEVVCGEYQKYKGTITYKGKIIRHRSYEESVKNGIHYLNFLWYENHCLPKMSVVDNQMLGAYWARKKRYGRINKKWIQFMKWKYQERHPNWKQKNWRDLTVDQQKILLYERYLNQPGELYVVAEPFTEISNDMALHVIKVFEELLEKDKTLILLSMNIQDLYNVCDEICMIRNGVLVKQISPSMCSKDEIWNYIS